MKLIKSELQEVYLNLVIQSFALSLIAIFVPIYLIQLGYSINQALIFVMIEVGLLSFFTPISALLAQKCGFKHIIAYRLPLLLAYFVGLYALNTVQIPIYAIAFVGGIGSSIYWFSLHSLFAKHSSKLHRGAQTGKLLSMPQIAALAGPSIGGVIAITLGFKVLIAGSAVLLLLSAVPLFFTGDMKPHVPHFSFRKMLTKKHLKFLTAFTAQGMMAIAGTVIWPLFVYFTLGDVASVGFMVTLTALGVIMFTLYVGKLSDSVGKTMFLRAGGILVALTFFLRIYANTISKVFAIAFMSGLFIVLIDLPMLKYFYDLANKEDLAEIVILRQIGLGIGRVAAVLILLFAINKFAVGLSLGGAAALVFSII